MSSCEAFRDPAIGRPGQSTYASAMAPTVDWEWVRKVSEELFRTLAKGRAGTHLLAEFGKKESSVVPCIVASGIGECEEFMRDFAGTKSEYAVKRFYSVPGIDPRAEKYLLALLDCEATNFIKGNVLQTACPFQVHVYSMRSG